MPPKCSSVEISGAVGEKHSRRKWDDSGRDLISRVVLATVVLICIIRFRKLYVAIFIKKCRRQGAQYWDKNEQMSTVTSCFEVCALVEICTFYFRRTWAESSPECYDWCETVKEMSFSVLCDARRKGNRKMIFFKRLLVIISKAKCWDIHHAINKYLWISLLAISNKISTQLHLIKDSKHTFQGK